MNLPNILTVARIGLSIVFLFIIFRPGLEAKAWALLTFLIAGLTDYWDGRIARQYGPITEFGKLMDPIADKILTLSAFTSFVQLGVIPAWMFIIILMRDILLTSARLTPQANAGNRASSRSGKYKTAFQFFAIFLVLIFLFAREHAVWRFEWEAPVRAAIYGVMLVVVMMTLWSGASYLLKHRELVGQKAGKI